MPNRHIVKLTDVKLITCVLQNGLAEEVLEAAKNVGVQGATVSFGQYRYTRSYGADGRYNR